LIGRGRSEVAAKRAHRFASPKASISALVNSLKGESSRMLREYRPENHRALPRGVLWSPSYFARSCGDSQSSNGMSSNNDRPHLLLAPKDEVSGAEESDDIAPGSLTYLVRPDFLTATPAPCDVPHYDLSPHDGEKPQAATVKIPHAGRARRTAGCLCPRAGRLPGVYSRLGV
jgi:hypothetical protein